MQTCCSLQLKITYADILCILRVRSNQTSAAFSKSLSIKVGYEGIYFSWTWFTDEKTKYVVFGR